MVVEGVVAALDAEIEHERRAGQPRLFDPLVGPASAQPIGNKTLDAAREIGVDDDYIRLVHPRAGHDALRLTTLEGDFRQARSNGSRLRGSAPPPPWRRSNARSRPGGARSRTRTPETPG